MQKADGSWCGISKISELYYEQALNSYCIVIPRDIVIDSARLCS